MFSPELIMSATVAKEPDVRDERSSFYAMGHVHAGERMTGCA
jgi:hypothetical protein